MSLLEELYSEDLIGDPETLDEVEERGEPLFLEGEGNDDAAIDHVLQTVPQSDNPAKPKRKVVKNPQPKLDAERLKGSRGLTALENIFKNYKFCGKGYEKKDLDQIMKRLEHWAHRLFPKYEFDDCLEKMESLGHKKPVMVYVKKIRMGLETAESLTTEPVTQDNDHLALPLDPFDELLGQQISEIQGSTSVGMPLQSFASSQSSIPSSPQLTKIVLTDEQRKRMEKNRLIAQERRLLRLKELQENQKQNEENSTSEIVEATGERNEIQRSKGQYVPVTEPNEEGNVSQPVESIPLTADKIPEMGAESFRIINKENSTTEISEATGERNDEIQTSEGHEVPATGSKSNDQDSQPVESVPLTTD
ncbi:Protein TIPIN homolog [Gryllus bimaculatus]|nr:Protein TIPIN homolog [Gryllus bimaculatus]